MAHDISTKAQAETGQPDVAFLPTEQEKTTEALSLLANLAYGDSGGSSAARSILLYAWDHHHPITEFYALSGRHRTAAVTIIDRPWAIKKELIESIVPEVRRWQDEARIENGSPR